MRGRVRAAGRAALSVAALAGLVAAAGSFGTGAPPAAAAGLPACPVSALTSAKGTVNIDFWESEPATQANGMTLATLTNKFNASQKKVHVTLVTQNGYTTTWTKFQAGLSNHTLPALAQLTQTDLQGALDTRAILPAQSCINAFHYATSDYVGRALSYYRVDNAQQALPFAVSLPVVYYNKLSFSAAGLNPTKPPATLPQFLADAKALKAHGTGAALKLDAWHLETWLATANQPFVNKDNGRSGRATKAVFDTPTAVKIFTDLDQLVTSGDATTNASSGPDDIDNLLGIGNGKYAMTIDSSGDLGALTAVAKTHPNVSLGVGPFPVYSAKVHGGVEPGGSALFICDKVPAAQQAAAWEYEAFLDNPTSQATWAAGTGYIPVRKSSTATATMHKLWATHPGFKVAYDELVNGPTTVATSGAVIGPYATVRKVVASAEESMYASGVKPSAALKTAQMQADAAITSYNQRVGAS